jgi:hypothetical protein
MTAPVVVLLGGISRTTTLAALGDTPSPRAVAAARDRARRLHQLRLEPQAAVRHDPLRRLVREDDGASCRDTIATHLLLQPNVFCALVNSMSHGSA